MKFIISYLAILIVFFLVFPFMLGFFITDNEITVMHTISVLDTSINKVIEIDLEEYIVSVVSAEMPATFSVEALKAQAVAARTYALRKVNKNLPEHKGADVCTDFNHCQAFISKEKMKKNWGINYEKYYDKIHKSVYDTKSQVLKYMDDFAITVFHSCSNGVTEKASDVWNGDIPYLINVDSDGDKYKPDYVSQVELSKTDFIDKIQKFTEKPVDISKQAISNIEMTSGKNISGICFFGEYIKGTDIRNIFSLKSTAFEIYENSDTYVFKVYGHGHGVGMSQYGADKMAKDGAKYKEILNHYYPGTKLIVLNN